MDQRHEATFPGLHSPLWPAEPGLEPNHSLCFFAAPAQRSAKRPWTSAADSTTTRSVCSGDSLFLASWGLLFPMTRLSPPFSLQDPPGGGQGAETPLSHMVGKEGWGERAGTGWCGHSDGCPRSLLPSCSLPKCESSGSPLPPLLSPPYPNSTLVVSVSPLCISHMHPSLQLWGPSLGFAPSLLSHWNLAVACPSQTGSPGIPFLSFRGSPAAFALSIPKLVSVEHCPMRCSEGSMTHQAWKTPG